MALWGNTDQESNKPKYLSDTLRNDQTTSDLDSTVGVNVSEAQATANRAKGIKTPGWTTTVTYTDAQGNTRNKTEVLVAMSSGATVAVMGDAADDSVVADLAITIGTQPANVTKVAPATATFSVVATVNSAAVPLVYQWQIQQEGAGAWANIAGATSASYTTGATAIGDGAGATDGDKYRVVITAGTATATSDAATLTVTAS